MGYKVVKETSPFKDSPTPLPASMHHAHRDPKKTTKPMIIHPNHDDVLFVVVFLGFAEYLFSPKHLTRLFERSLVGVGESGLMCL